MEFPKLKNQLILAPLEEVSGLPFRLLCRQYGAALAYTEMASSHGIQRNNPSTLRLLETSPQDKPLGMQLCGQDTNVLLLAAKKLQKNCQLIDINMGCPSTNIIQQGAGSALLKRKNKIKEIIDTLSQNLDIPVTAKIRLGFSKPEALEITRVIEKAGAAAITIHARTALAKSQGKAQWELIKQVKEQSSLPIIGNGDVFSAEAAREMLKIADYCMIARGAIRNPQIFRESLEFIETGSYHPASPEEKIETFFEYYELNKKYPYGKFKILKQRAQDFTHGLKNSSQLRLKLNNVKTEEQLVEIMEEYEKELKY